MRRQVFTFSGQHPAEAMGHVSWGYIYRSMAEATSGLQARSKDLEILEEGGGAGPSNMPRRDHE